MATKKQGIRDILVQRGLAKDRKEAEALVLAGKVLVNEQRCDKAGALVAEDAVLRLKDVSPYVSRGGEKLAGAIADLGIASLFTGAVVLDAGASTGGFTDCALQHGAKHVYAVDVGTNQLAWKLRTDPRVAAHEQTDIRAFHWRENEPVVNMVLADISFHDLASLVPVLLRLAPGRPCHFLLLVKPQFEVDPADVPKGGVITDERQRQASLAKIQGVCAAAGLPPGRAVDSRLPGRTGNREIFYYVAALS